MLAKLDINQTSLKYINDKKKNKTNTSLYSMTIFIDAKAKTEKRCIRDTKSYFSSLANLYIVPGLRKTAAVENIGPK